MVNPLYPLHASRKLPAPTCDNQKCLHTLPIVPWGAKWPWVRTLTLSKSAYAFAHILAVSMPDPVGVPCVYTNRVCPVYLPWGCVFCAAWISWVCSTCTPCMCICVGTLCEWAVSASCVYQPAPLCACNSSVHVIARKRTCEHRCGEHSGGGREGGPGTGILMFLKWI